MLLPLPDGASQGIGTAVTTNSPAAGYTCNGEVTVNASGHGYVGRDGHYKDIGSLGGGGSSRPASRTTARS